MTWFGEEFDDSSYLDFILNFNDNNQQPQPNQDALKNTHTDNNQSTVIPKEDQDLIPEKTLELTQKEQHSSYVDSLINYNDTNQPVNQEISQSRTESINIQNNSSDTGNQAEADEDVVPDYILQQLQEEEHDGPEIICISSDDETDYENELNEQDDQTEKENLPVAIETDCIDILSSDEDSDDDDFKFLYEIPGTRKRSRASSSNYGRITHVRLFNMPVPKLRRPSRPPKNTEGAIPYRDGMDADIYCCQCRVRLVGDEIVTPLAQRVFVPKIKKYVCLGCHRLLQIPNSITEKRDMVNWLVSGKLSKYDTPPRQSPKQVWDRIKFRRAGILKRCKNKQCDSSLFVTESQIFDLCRKYNNKCAITGFSTYWHDYKRSRLPFWALTFDHIIPLYDCCQFREAWSHSNIQIMSLALNKVKGHYSDNEVKRWYSGFIRATVIEL